MKLPLVNASCMLLFLFFSVSAFPQTYHCIELNICDINSCSTTFAQNLTSLNLKKRDLLSVTIRGVNPYLYDIRVTAKNDTLKAGTPPPLFSEFMDISKLGAIAANLNSLTATVALPPPTMNTMQKNGLSGDEFIKISDDYTLSDSIKVRQLLQIGTSEFSPFVKNGSEIIFNLFIEKKTVDSSKDEIYKLAGEVNTLHNDIKEYYNNSVLSIYNAKLDCITKKKCFEEAQCDTQKKIKPTIPELEKKRVNLYDKIQTQLSKPSISLELKKFYEDIQKEITKVEYEKAYLNTVYAKAYTNFNIAEDMVRISTYNSLPIQVQGDKFELKIDITPKKSTTQSSEATKKVENKANDENQKNVTTFSNQSPITININTDTKPLTPDSNSTTKKVESKPTVDMSLNTPVGILEYHLNYKFRTTSAFYGFSTGFFVDWLHDDQYVNKPVDPNNPNTQYNIVKERREKNDPSKYGIMATVNIGTYLCKSRFFLQLFTGPGLSIEQKIQPRLLIGGGFGFGDFNKFSVNGGVAIGQVKKISNVIDLGQQYSIPQTNIYTSTTKTNLFIAISYVFGS